MVPIKHLILLLLLLPLGCTPDAYKRSADQDVQRILEDRKKSVLDYQPPTPLEPDPPEARRVEKTAYERIPATALAPLNDPIVDRWNDELPYGVLGPDEWVADMPPGEPAVDLFGIEAQLQQETDQFAYGPPPPVEDIVRLDFFGALRYATQHSRSYQTQAENVYLTALDVTLERHLFSPRPFARTSLNYEAGRFDSDVNYRAALVATQSVGIRQQLPYGGEIIAEGLVNFVDALRGEVESGESAELALRGAIPLLRGAGMVNLEPLIQSEREVIYQIRAFEDFRRAFVIQIASRYYNLINAQIGLANRRLNYVNLLMLTERTQALYDAGRINFQQVQRAFQAQLRAERLLISAQNNYRSALDEFKIFIGMPVETELEIVPVQLQLEVPRDEVADAVALATKYRLDLQTARDRIEDARRLVQLAENGLLPDLDITGGYRVGNEEDSPARSVRGSTGRYSAGISLDWPIDRVAERNAYRRALIQLQRTQRQYEETRERVGLDARDALRAIRTAELQLRVAEAGIELARERLEYSNELLKDGRADSRDVVEAQSSLLEAQDSYDDARTTLQISILAYMRDTGILRIDPDSGAIGRAMNPSAGDPVR